MTHTEPLVESENMPVHFCNILHALRMYDRFENTFLRWSVSKQRDRQLLVLTLADDATLSQSIVSTICMLYPRRIAGPFLCKNTFTVEFLDETTKYDDSVAIDLQGGTKRKRAPVHTGDYIEGISRDIYEHLSALNASDVTIAKTTTGEDSDGKWLSFELNETSRINLCFMCNVYTGEYSDAIKLLFIKTGPMVSIECKLYKDEDRRVVSGWDVVPVYKSSGVFTVIRSRRA